jgi:hypothetical protein
MRQSSSTFEAAADRVRELNERVIESSSTAGVAGLLVYGRLLQRLAESQEQAGKHGSQWLMAFGQAQATFSRDLAQAMPAVARTTAERVRGAATATKRTAATTTATARTTARKTAAKKTAVRKPTATRRRGAATSANGKLPIANYDKLTAKEIESRLKRLSKPDLSKVATYERKHKNRATVLKKVESLRS